MSRPLNPMAMLLAVALGVAEGTDKPGTTHKHRCGFEPMREHRLGRRWVIRYRRVGGCGLVFEHERPPPTATAQEYAAAHLCRCGFETRWVYMGRRRAGTGKLPEVPRGLLRPVR